MQINFLILKLFAPTKELRHKFKTKQKGFQCIGLRKFPLGTKEITDELHRAKRIASDFDEETKRIRSKLTDAGYLKHVIENTIRTFNRRKDDPLIPPWLFDKRKHVAIRLPFSSKNKKYSAYFINK